MKTRLSLILAALSLCALALPADAQTVTQTSTGLALSVGGITVPAIVGTPITINGQTLLIATNASGGYTVVTYGAYGSITSTPPHNLSDVGAFVEQALQNNNPANASFYSTNGEWDLSLAGVFAQNSGQAAAQLEVDRYGLFKSLPNLGFGAAILEGNQGGQNGTAAAYGSLLYRHPIGNVAFIGSLGGGYDNYTGKPMAIPRVEIEYRENAHLGQFVGVGYDFEGLGQTKTQTGKTLNNPNGIIIGGGIRYAF